jgi:hypothetical protein
VVENDDSMVQVPPESEKPQTDLDDEATNQPKYTGVYDSAKLFEIITSIQDSNHERYEILNH